MATFGGEAKCKAARPQNLLIRQEKAQQGKIPQKRGAAAPASTGCPLDALSVQINEKIPRGAAYSELSEHKRASSTKTLSSAGASVPALEISKKF